MNDLKKLITLLETFETNSINYNLQKIRNSIMINVAIPGQRWEIEFMEDGSIEIEKFFSSGVIYTESEIDILLKEYSD